MSEAQESARQPSGKEGAERVRQWPANRPPQAGESIRTACVHCGLQWDVHVAMAGFRLRCECDTWVPVPHPLVDSARSIAAAQFQRDYSENFALEAPLELPGEDTQKRVAKSVRERTEKPTRGSRAKLLSPGLFGTLGLCAAVAVPVATVSSEYAPISWAILWPSMAALTTVLLGIAALFGRARYLAALRPASISHHFEGLGAGLLGGAALTYLMMGMPQDHASLEWMRGLIGELGVPVAALALVPLTAIGHGLFFREVLSRRLQVLASPPIAAGLAALALAFSHGVGLHTAILALIAFHGAWLRGRSRSAVPGLIEDLAVAGFLFTALVTA